MPITSVTRHVGGTILRSRLHRGEPRFQTGTTDGRATESAEAVMDTALERTIDTT
jgi:hypothetical protein